MIPTKKKVEVRLNGLESNTFSMAITEKSFRILLDGLYTDKEQSIIRELWANSYDSHVQAGNPEVPFDCKLPTSLDPTFYVRDYGVGMSHDNVMHFYSQVFASDKTQTNDQMGCWGLGSKSPFAYTDSFSVNAFDGAEKRTYIAALNDDGIPTITHLSTVPCDEPRGFKVEFQVMYDSGLFLNAAERVIKGYADCPPNIIGVDNIKIPEPDFRSDTLEIYLRDRYESGVVYVKMGRVLYPLPRDVTRPIRTLVHDYGSNDVVIEVPIGSIDIAANREAVQLTPETREFLIETISEQARLLEETAIQDMYDAPTYLEACKSYAYWRNITPGLGHKSHNYKGSDFSVGPTIYFHDPTLQGYHDGNKRKPVSIDFSNKVRHYGWYVSDLPHLVFVIDDGTKMVRKKMRIKEFLKHHGLRATVLENPTSRHISRLMRCLGLSREQFIHVSKLDDVERASDGSTRKPDPDSLQGVFSFTNYSSYQKIDSVSALPLDRPWYALEAAALNGEAIKLPSINYNCRFSTQYYDGITDILNLVQWFDAEGILFLGPRAVKKLGDTLDPNMELDAFVNRKIIENSDKVVQALSAYNAAQRLPRCNFGSGVTLEALGMNPDQGRPARARAVPNILHRLSNISFFEKNGIDLDSQNDFDEDALKEKYPLLFGQPSREDIANYIKLCDSQNN